MRNIGLVNNKTSIMLIEQVSQYLMFIIIPVYVFILHLGF